MALLIQIDSFVKPQKRCLNVAHGLAGRETEVVAQSADGGLFTRRYG